MATTVTAPVTNNIALASKFLPMLDEIYKAESRSAILDTVAERVEFTGANTVNIFTLNTMGMSNYDRNAGFVPGDVNGTWQPYVLETDRGRSYMVDVLDNDETLGMAVGGLLSTVERQHIIPEVDAFRFSAYASGAAAGNVTTETLSAGAATVASIDAACVALDNAEVPYEGRILFVSPSVYGLLKSGLTRYLLNDERNVNTNVEFYNDMRVISVPQPRFQTAITLNAPTASNAAGGFAPASDASAINYMIIHPSAVLQVMKHYVPRLFSPEVNQEADAWKLNVRFAHGAWVLSQKTNGIYVSHA